MRALNGVAIAALVASLCAAACEQKKEEAPEATKTEAKAQAEAKAAAEKKAEAEKAKQAQESASKIVLAGIDNFNSGKLDDALSTSAKDIEWSIAGTPAAKGIAEVKKAWEQVRTGFPDMKLNVERVIEAGDVTVTQYTVTGTQKGEYRGMKPTNKPFGVQSVLFTWIDQGKVQKHSVVENQAAIMQQLGAAPEGQPVAVAEPPSGKPELIKGKPNPAAEKLVTEWYQALGPDAAKACKEKFCAENIVHHDVASGTTEKGIAEAQKHLTEMFTTFPDVKSTVKTIGSAGNYVVALLEAKGTQKGALGPIKASNKPVDVTVAEVVKVDGGKIQESWTYINQAEILRQIGVMKPMPGAETEGAEAEGAAEEGADKAAAKPATAEGKPAPATK